MPEETENGSESGPEVTIYIDTFPGIETAGTDDSSTDSGSSDDDDD